MVEPMDQSSGLVTRPTRSRLDEQIVDQIVEAVIEGRLPVGAPLPAERELAGQLGVNRTSLRQALARLEQIGLVTSRQGSGTVVRDLAALTDPVVVQAVVRRVGADMVHDLVELRSELGGMMGRLAARRATADGLDALRDALVAVEDATTAETRQRAELTFVAALVDATGNRALRVLVRWVESTYGVAPDVFAEAFADAEAVESGLRRILTNVARGHERGAAAAMEDYLRASGERLEQALATTRRT
ncbi:MAG: GntR family transcriptional regulator [Acidimicrobiia bacterium]|nr:GntR family transcriptional regulator [Acidimicrobiia bacterium]